MEGKGWGKCADQHFCLFLLLFKKWVGIAKVVVRIAILVHKIFNTNLGRSSICTSLHYFGGPRHTWYTIHHFFQSSNQSRCKVLLYTLMYYNFSHLHLLFNHLPLLQPPWCLCHSLSYTPIGGNYRWRRRIFSLLMSSHLLQIHHFHFTTLTMNSSCNCKLLAFNHSETMPFMMTFATASTPSSWPLAMWS